MEQTRVHEGSLMDGLVYMVEIGSVGMICAKGCILGLEWKKKSIG